MNFNKTNSSSSSNTSTVSQQNCTKLIEEIHSFWIKLYEKNEKINNDINNLERMFNDYKSNPIFINVKEVLQVELEENKMKINSLEEQLYILKRNFNIT
jgi:hypothetical protein